VGAIERNRGEVDVASLTQRGGVMLTAFAPDLAAGLIRRLGGTEVALEMDQALRDKR
jgi:hypothetical protein